MKPESSGKIVITNDIEEKSDEETSPIITKKWRRNCPSFGKALFYSRKYDRNHAEEEHWTCSVCGGKEQKSDYKIDCRWSPSYLVKKIMDINSLFQNKTVKCTCEDFSNVISDTSEKALIYLDPPYYVEGNKLYQCGFTDDDHTRLMGTLKKSPMRWVLSYDDDENRVVRKLYEWATIKTISVKYSITALKVEEKGEMVRKSREKPELLISPSYN